jgi:hypothetical protein
MVAGIGVGAIIATGDGIVDGVIIAIGDGIAIAGTAVGELRTLRPEQARLVVRFQHSHPIAASTFANVGIKGPLEKILILVELWI